MSTIVEVQEYWDRQPCNIWHSNAEFMTPEYFIQTERRKYFVEPHIPEFAQFTRWMGKSVFEVGCGIGIDGINFRRAGARYTGIDISEKTVDIANTRFTSAGYKPHCYQHNAEEKLHIRDVDLMYSFGVLHHTPNPDKVILNMRRAISKKGELRIMLYAKHSFKNAMITAGADQYEAQNNCPIATTYTESDVEALLNGCFEIESIEQKHIFPYVVEKYKNYEYEKQPYFRSMNPDKFAILERIWGWHLLIVARPR